ncbi:unnamed protein product [Toxocara canis]|uniref:Ulp1 protease family protein n=1 Tax=Toxocara canis TaxID=6265 RepID=A0A183V7K5_TOXCA|nr:unnamed protein product [Toxocara canis]
MKAHFSHKDRASLTLPLTAPSLEHSQSVGEQAPTKTTSRSISESYNTSFSTAQPVVNPHSRGSGGTTSRLRAQLSRGQSIRETLSNSTARFFGVPPPIDRQQSFSFGTSHDPRWTLRRLRYMNRRYGGLNEQAKRELDSRVVDDLADLASQLATPSTTALQPVTPISALEPSAYTPGLVSRSVSTESRASRIIPPFERRDSVAKMAWDSLSSIVQRGTFRSSARRQVAPPPGILRGRSPSSSFSPFTVQPVGGGPRLLNADASAVVQDAAVSVPQMTTVEEVDEESGRITSATAQDVTSEITKTERRDEHPASPKSATSADSIQDEVFFDVSPIGQQPMRPTLLVLPGQTNFAVISPSAGPFIDHRPAYSEKLQAFEVARIGVDLQQPMASKQLRHRMRPERLHRQESFDAGVQTPVGLQEGSLQAEAQRPVRSQEGSFQAGPQTPDTLRGNRIVTRVGDVRRKKYEIAGELLSRARITKPPRGSSILEAGL